MSQALFYAAVAACFVVLAVLAVGIFSFAKGGEFNRKYSNKIMRLRIATQAIAVVLILAAVLAAQMES
ncbi:MAG: twin transmembrane helix small protein [Pseudomonadota bacterium]